MRTTISLPDELFAEAREAAGNRSFSDFASEAIRQWIERVKRESLEREMEAGYRAEARHLSLDAGWSDIETEGL